MAKRRLPSNWRSRIELVVTDEDRSCSFEYPTILWELRFQLGRTPRGFDRVIGVMEVGQKSPHIVEDAWVRDYLLRRGLGTLMYLRALKKCGSLTTVYHKTSKDAQGMWQSLVRTHRYEQDFFSGLLTIFQAG